MDHIKYIDNSDAFVSEALANKLSGRYYTHEIIAKNGIEVLLNELSQSGFTRKTLKVIDPFGGDGRLVCWLIEEWRKSDLDSIKWEVHLWDIHKEGLDKAKESFQLIQESGVEIEYTIRCADSFRLALDNLHEYF